MLFRHFLLLLFLSSFTACQLRLDSGPGPWNFSSETDFRFFADSGSGFERTSGDTEAVLIRKRETFGKIPYVFGTVWGQSLLYPWNRFLDILDFVRLNVGIGPAIGGNIRITRWLSFGLEAGNSRHFGLPGSHRNGWFLQRKWFWKDRNPWRRTVGLKGFGTPIKPRRKEWEVGATLHGFIGTLDVAIDFLALGDFILGIFFLDPEFDDDQWELPQYKSESGAIPEEKEKN